MKALEVRKNKLKKLEKMRLVRIWELEAEIKALEEKVDNLKKVVSYKDKQIEALFAEVRRK